MNNDLLININFYIFAPITNIGEKLKIIYIYMKVKDERFPFLLFDLEGRFNF